MAMAMVIKNFIIGLVKVLRFKDGRNCAEEVNLNKKSAELCLLIKEPSRNIIKAPKLWRQSGALGVEFAF